MVLEPRIGMRCIKTDGKDEFKEPAWRKDGCYTVATVKHFNLSQESGRTTRPIEGAYCRISFEQGKVGSIEVVKDWLYSMGWVPDEWNVEKINGKFVNKSPKITASSLEKLGADAMLVSEYYTIRSRKGILEGWIEAVKESPDNRLHGRMWTIGTPTFRCRHEVVANIPSVDSVYGKEMRALLISEPGTSIVGADSAGNQMRGLCHYINNDDFTNEVINGDVHQKNADILSGVHPCPRRTAKPWLYAYLFGAGPGKLGIILTGKTDVKIGKESASLFETSIPGLKELKDKLSNLFDKTSGAFGKDKAFIRGLDGRMVFVSSQHQVLNYLLQTAEGITCKAAIVWLTKELNKRNIPYYYTLHYHDELVVVCKDEHAEEIKQLSIQSFIEAPKDFGVMCMGGDAHIGKTYAEVH
jgi:DNA polymerase I-like protein with 3'-5' exonuclease and polymerase domains